MTRCALLAAALFSFALVGRAEPKPKSAANFGRAIQHDEDQGDPKQPQKGASDQSEAHGVHARRQSSIADTTMLEKDSRPVEPMPPTGMAWLSAGGGTFFTGAVWVITGPSLTCAGDKSCATGMRVGGVIFGLVSIPMFVMGFVQQSEYDDWQRRRGLQDALNTTIELRRNGAMLTHTFAF